MSEFLEAGNTDDVGERDYISRNKKDQNVKGLFVIFVLKCRW